MREMFNAIDKDRSGSVTLTELVQGLRWVGRACVWVLDCTA
jgi:Ca2+-binding EF-hand superfamily protein